MIRIERRSLQPFRFSLPSAVVTARRAWKERETLLLTLFADNGRQGVGEAAPLPNYSPDELDHVKEELEAAVIPTWNIDREIPITTQVTALLDETGVRSPSGRFALESAFLDLAAQSRGITTVQLLRGSAGGSPVPVNVLLMARTPEKALREAEPFFTAGYRTFKAKIGRAGSWDRETALLGALRRRFGREIAIRADANGAWSLHEARRRLDELAALDLEYLEQPVPGMELAQLSDSPVPLAADEALAEPGAATALIDSGAVAVLILKPMLLGGAAACIDLTAKARTRGLRVTVTGMFDGPVARRFTRNLALALDPPPLACGIQPDQGRGPFLFP